MKEDIRQRKRVGRGKQNSAFSVSLCNRTSLVSGFLMWKILEASGFPCISMLLHAGKPFTRGIDKTQGGGGMGGGSYGITESRPQCLIQRQGRERERERGTRATRGRRRITRTGFGSGLRFGLLCFPFCCFPFFFFSSWFRCSERASRGGLESPSPSFSPCLVVRLVCAP